MASPLPPAASAGKAVSAAASAPDAAARGDAACNTPGCALWSQGAGCTRIHTVSQHEKISTLAIRLLFAEDVENSQTIFPQDLFYLNRPCNG